MSEQRPSKKQLELLNFIEGFIKGNGYGPSYREIMRALDYKSVSTVAVHVDGLIVRGYLRKRDHSARSLEVVDTPQISRNPVEKDGDKLHERWLVNLVEEKIQDVSSDVANHGTLVKALDILGFHGESRRIDEKLRRNV